MLHEALQPLLAPVVLISACGLMIMALNARMMTAKARIRQLHHERLEICEKAGEVGTTTMTQQLRYEGVGRQSDNILCRLGLMRSALMCMVGCVVLMLTSSIFIGLDSLNDESPFDSLAIFAFVTGILSMFAGAVIFLLELRLSLREINYEHQRIMSLTLPNAEEGASL
jgi:hypothetical protein